MIHVKREDLQPPNNAAYHHNKRYGTSNKRISVPAEELLDLGQPRRIGVDKIQLAPNNVFAIRRVLRIEAVLREAFRAEI